MQVSLVIFEDAVLSAVSGAIDLISGANRYLQERGKEPAFELQLVSENAKSIHLNVPAQFFCFKTIDEIAETDLIIIPAFSINPDAALQKNKAIVDWIKAMKQSGTEIASLCFGSYFLAEAGLLDGKTATSHWAAISDMQQRYPNVTMLSDRVITDRDGVYTSGGAFSSLTLIVYLVEKFCGREAAIWVSKMYAVDMDRLSQAHFSVFKGQHNHFDSDILKAQQFIEQNFDSDITIDQIAEQAHMSKRNFIRRFKAATQNTPLEYLQRVRVESAKKSLEMNEQNIAAMVYDVGYNDLKTFRMVFKRITGLTPQEYRKKYARPAVA